MSTTTGYCRQIIATMATTRTSKSCSGWSRGSPRAMAEIIEQRPSRREREGGYREHAEYEEGEGMAPRAQVEQHLCQLRVVPFRPTARKRRAKSTAPNLEQCRLARPVGAQHANAARQLHLRARPRQATHPPLETVVPGIPLHRGRWAANAAVATRLCRSGVVHTQRRAGRSANASSPPVLGSPSPYLQRCIHNQGLDGIVHE